MLLIEQIHQTFGISPKDSEKIVDFFQPTTLSKGDFFLKGGQYADKLSFIQSGWMRIYAQTEKKEVTQWISTPGYFVTDLASLIFQSPARWSIQALTDCSLFTIYRRDYQRIGDFVPKWHELEKLFLAKCFIILENRVFKHLSMSSEERYESLFEEYPELFNEVPLQYLASMLGMTPETFSRIRNKRML